MSEQKSNGKSIAALVLGILSVLIPFIGIIFGILAIIFGIQGKKQIQETGEAGKGMATAGLVLGIIGVAYLFLWILIGGLAYFGALDPSNAIPESTYFDTVLSSTKPTIVDESGLVQISAINTIDSQITISKMYPKDSTFCLNPEISPITVDPAEEFILEFRCDTMPTKSFFMYDFVLEYNRLDSDILQIIRGSIAKKYG
ncbi:MAG: DUF4190 domain-containing protein [Nanoarchaeota archaeon]|nr:DUF4190 domain-containing protein [Nanoarchaeota archaeon]